MSEHPIAERIINLLQIHNCWYDAFEHEMVRTSEEAAALRADYSLEQGAKALIVKVSPSTAERKFVMVVLPGDKKFSGAKIKRFLAVKEVRFATEDEVLKLTDGVQPGGVPPMGSLFGLKVIADKTLLEHDAIVFNAGRNFTIAMRSSDYRKLVVPMVTDIVAD